MIDLEFTDLYISPNDYLDICEKVAAESDFFNDMDDKKWHPEDLYYNMSTITETVGKTLMHYVSLINTRRVRRNSPATVNIDELMRKYQAANPARTQVFGGTVPSSEFDAAYSMPNVATYAGNNLSGDNV
jgi:hypothetical protein